MEEKASLVDRESGQGRLSWRETSYQIQVGLIGNASDRCESLALFLLLWSRNFPIIVYFLR